MLTHLITANPLTEFAHGVREGLTREGQKELPSKYLYDSLGSILFEAICETPEYGVTRAEERILSNHAPEIVSYLPPNVIVAELGSGTGKKTRYILESLSHRQSTSYYPIEISRSALAVCERELRDINSISIVGFEREYLEGLLEVTSRRHDGQHLMVLFLGSTIGNFDREAGVDFLQKVHRLLRKGDSLLLGADLEKPTPVLLAAYDDGLRITAAFNRNLLARINRELYADIDLANFEHLARFNSGARSVEMHLLSTKNQSATIPGAGITVNFRKGETVWTESCHKFQTEELRDMASRAHFRCEAQWLDHEWPFAENLWIAE
jgi:L-histidine N-alpha-methyltransferase